ETVLTLKKSKKENTGDSAQKVESFITKYRKIILTVFIILVAAAVAVCAVVLVNNKLKNDNLSAIYTIEQSYIDEVAAVEEKYSAEAKESSETAEAEETEETEEKAVELTEEEKAAKKAEKDAAVAKAIKALGSYVSKSGVAGVRANMLAAGIYYDAGDFVSAQDCYLAAASKDKKAYTYPVCYSNAASCAIELGNYKDAASYFETAASVKGYLLASHDLFRYGMAMELAEDYKAAAKIYQKVVDTYNDDWANLAQTCLIKLSSSGKN
ncbi:hypothetical protein, partial [Treponema sp.]|uniref:tetratricopeptide repeat protein n=1 Tax=Treponema sp. TaxID=166 RepID=UPI0025F7940B